MSFKVELLSGEPIILNTWYADFDFANEEPMAKSDIKQLLDRANGPTHLINNWLAFSHSLEELMVGASGTTRGDNPLFHHPNIGKIVFVTTSATMKTAAEGMASEQWGKVQIATFETLDEALDYVRSDE